MGTRQPNSRIDSATASTAESFFRGLFSYGLTDSTGLALNSNGPGLPGTDLVYNAPTRPARANRSLV